MARRVTPIGTYGEITTFTERGTKYASARFRDFDGKSRRVKRSGRTYELARTALREALADRATPISGNIDRDMKLKHLLDIYEAELLASDKADGTKLNYQSHINGAKKALGEIRLHECTPGRLDTFIRVVAEDRPGSARMTRQVLKQVMSIAVLHGVFPSNPITETRTVASKVPDFSAIGKDDLGEIRELLNAWDTGKDKRGAVRSGSLRDITDMYIATGARTSEVLALTFPDFTIEPALREGDKREPATVRVWKTVARNIQNKYVIMERLKTDGGKRELELPYEVVPMIMRRQMEAYTELVFPSSTGTVRSPDNFRRDWHAALKGSPYEGLKPGLYRKSVATLIARTLGEKQAADQLGHAGLGNLRYYVERTKRGPQVAAVLGELFG